MSDTGPQSAAGTPAGVAENKALIAHMHSELVEARDKGAVERFFAADFVSHSMPAPLTPTARARGASWRESQRRFPT